MHFELSRAAIGPHRLAMLGCMAVAAGLMPLGAAAATYRIEQTLMTGLANPRGLTFGPNGALYVAEAGSGGNLGTIMGAEGPVSLGYTSGVSRYQGGVQTRVVSGLASLAPEGGGGATGVHDLAFDSMGRMHAVIGLGAPPAARAQLSGVAGSELLGTLVSLDGGTVSLVADLAAFEEANDPGGEGPDSNPFGLVATESGFMVTDAGANDVLTVNGGTIGVAAVLPPQPNPLPFGPPVYQAVPTGAALGLNGELIFGQLTGFPFPVGAANVFGLDEDALAVLAGGFTNLIDVAVGLDGTIFALELDSDSLLGPGQLGAVYSIDADGLKTLLFGDLLLPTGLAVDARGDLYVAINGFSPTDGSVVRLSPVPLPAALPLLGGGLLLMGGWMQRARRRG